MYFVEKNDFKIIVNFEFFNIDHSMPQIKLVMCILPKKNCFNVVFMASFLCAVLLIFSCNKEELFVEQVILPEEDETELPDEQTPEDEDSGDSDISVILLEDVAVETFENTPVSIDIFTEDTNVPSDFIVSFNNLLNGTIGIDNKNTPDNIKDDVFTYTPNASFSGMETFQYTVCNPLNPENCGAATVTVVVDSFEEPILGELKAFPEAEGFGKYSKGGRGGEVFKVTNLNNSGSGSLRAALEASASSRTIVFEVSGTITLSSSLRVPSNTTIAGQTAYRTGGQGITIRSNGSYGSSLMTISSDDIIIRYIRFRRGRGTNNEQNGDNVTITSGNNIIFDHCSFSWSTDESFNT